MKGLLVLERFKIFTHNYHMDGAATCHKNRYILFIIIALMIAPRHLSKTLIYPLITREGTTPKFHIIKKINFSHAAT